MIERLNELVILDALKHCEEQEATINFARGSVYVSRISGGKIVGAWGKDIVEATNKMIEEVNK